MSYGLVERQWWYDDHGFVFKFNPRFFLFTSPVEAVLIAGALAGKKLQTYSNNSRWWVAGLSLVGGGGASLVPFVFIHDNPKFIRHALDAAPFVILGSLMMAMTAMFMVALLRNRAAAVCSPAYRKEIDFSNILADLKPYSPKWEKLYGLIFIGAIILPIISAVLIL